VAFTVLNLLMASTTFDLDSWRWNEGVTPLSHWTVPVFGSSGYLLLIYLIVVFMKNRKPFELKLVSTIHNINMIIISFVMWVGVLYAAYDLAKREGVVSLLCERQPNAVNGRIGFWIYIFYASKYYEFGDTIIMALRKKPIIFLHLFHHTAVIPCTYMWLRDQWLPGAWWCVNVNSLVHVFMYYYYFLTAQGKTVWWKRYITVGQLIQFFTGFGVITAWLILRKQPGYQCTGGLPAAMISHTSNSMLIFLFYKFYYKTYISDKKSINDKDSNVKSKKVE